MRYDPVDLDGRAMEAMGHALRRSGWKEAEHAINRFEVGGSPIESTRSATVCVPGLERYVEVFRRHDASEGSAESRRVMGKPIVRRDKDGVDHKLVVYRRAKQHQRSSTQTLHARWTPAKVLLAARIEEAAEHQWIGVLQAFVTLTGWK